jgi:hypothetical protein
LTKTKSIYNTPTIHILYITYKYMKLKTTLLLDKQDRAEISTILEDEWTNLSVFLRQKIKEKIKEYKRDLANNI